MAKINFKKVIRKIHLWFGLSSGIIVFIVAVTGCLYAFQEEIQNYTEVYRFVEKQNTPFLLPSKLEVIAQKQLPDKSLHSIKYNSNNKSVEAIFYHYEPTYYYTVFLNPYTGEVLKTVNMEEGFFRWVLDGHFYLWLPHEIGQTVIASATLVFVLMLISGFILWYPKNKKAAQQRFWFKWKKGMKWKRKNYDLHNIIGFYTLSIALVFAITGLVWGFPWFAYLYHKALGGETSLIYDEPKSKIINTNTTLSINSLDKTYLFMIKEYPTASSIEVHPPENKVSPIAANANTEEGTFWKMDYRYFDQYTLKELDVNHIYGRLKNTDFADTVLRMNYDIHTGAILGIAGKIFAFLISLLIATMPITGFYIWYGRLKKDNKTNKVA